MRGTHKTPHQNTMNKTKNISEIPVRKGAIVNNLYTNSVFFFKENGVKYYIDQISSDMGVMHIRNSKTGETKIMLVKSEIENGRYSQTYFFQYD